MKPLSENQIRASFVNCSRGEARRLTLPPRFNELDWSALTYLGWIDPKATIHGYLVVERGEEVEGIALRCPKSHAGSTVPQQCSLCLTTHTGSGVALMVAQRAGTAGRRGNTLGTYICADLACSLYLRGTRQPGATRQMAETLSIEERIARAQMKANAFVDAVCAEEPSTSVTSG